MMSFQKEEKYPDLIYLDGKQLSGIGNVTGILIQVVHSFIER